MTFGLLSYGSVRHMFTGADRDGNGWEASNVGLGTSNRSFIIEG